jgi:DNA-binding beta-propeller fold protein YncE
MKSLCVVLPLFAFATALTLSAADSPAGYHLIKTIPLEGDGSQDYLAIDQTARRLYVSHYTEVDVIDLDSENLVGKITGMNGVHGIVVAPALGRGFISSGNTATVKIFDLKTFASIADVPTGTGPDGLLFEPVTQRVFSFNHRGSSLTVIDAVAGKPIATIDLGGQPEFPVTDGKGMVWDIIEDKSMLIKMDAKSLEIVGRWPLAPGEGPSGMAFDQANRRLFIGSNNKVLVVVDADSGKIVADLPIGVHIDAEAFDPKSKLIFSANRGSVTISHQDDKDHYSNIGTLTTWPHANTLALDEVTGKIYLAASQYKDEPPASAGAKPKSTKLPGTFSVLIYGRD